MSPAYWRRSNRIPVAIAAAILICSIAARVIGRAALYAFRVVLMILVGAFWTKEFLAWMD